MAKASLISQKSTSLALRPARSRAFKLAGTGPWPMMVGSTPTKEMERMVARGLTPFFLANSLDISIRPVPAAFRGELTPAVITPSFLKAGLSLARSSRVVSPRTAWSLVTLITLPSAWGASTGRISSAKKPSAWAWAAR